MALDRRLGEGAAPAQGHQREVIIVGAAGPVADLLLDHRDALLQVVEAGSRGHFAQACDAELLPSVALTATLPGSFGHAVRVEQQDILVCRKEGLEELAGILNPPAPCRRLEALRSH
jgi:hypothetical protein